MYALDQLDEAMQSLFALRDATEFVPEEDRMNALDIEHLKSK